MGVGNFSSKEGPITDFSWGSHKIFPEGGAKSGEVLLFPLETKKTTFFC